jgi:hypothetical protein
MDLLPDAAQRLQIVLLFVFCCQETNHTATAPLNGSIMTKIHSPVAARIGSGISILDYEPGDFGGRSSTELSNHAVHGMALDTGLCRGQNLQARSPTLRHLVMLKFVFHDMA